MKWENWMYAPKDGSNIIAVHTDLSGCNILFWGESNQGEPGWVTSDGEFEGEDSNYGGWVVCPEQPTNNGDDNGK